MAMQIAAVCVAQPQPLLVVLQMLRDISRSISQLMESSVYSACIFIFDQCTDPPASENGARGLENNKGWKFNSVFEW